jgi:hypothetical protein
MFTPSAVLTDIYRALHSKKNDIVIVEKGAQQILEGLCSNRNTPHEILRELAHTSQNFLRHVGTNIKAPIDALEALAINEDPYCRRLAAGHRATPADYLVKLTHDQDMNTRQYALWNTSARATDQSITSDTSGNHI